ncbi:MAG: hydantoinase/oxoprolinase family protein [Pseudomonadota bacterium]
MSAAANGAASDGARAAVDIGGTFTDVAVELGGRRWTGKTLTTHTAPHEGVMEGLKGALEEAGLAPADVGLIVHGTTLATNALIERRGAVTALLATEGHRDAVEMAHENRFDQYDIGGDRRPPLVPRYLRLPIRERMNWRGEALLPLEPDSVRRAAEALAEEGAASLAIGFLHSYANPAHERMAAEIIAERLPNLSITLSSDVCPEIREYERLSTACANAYVRPLMDGYLKELEAALGAAGYACPLLLMTSGGGLTTLETARAFPVRLIESGPAGGAILASDIAKRADLSRVLSFDMGGTTAKLCLIDDGAPLASRSFEVDRAARFKKGSGLPVRIPVIEMVEIGAGGGSIARADSVGRLRVGPDSAGSEPGPAAYGRGGTSPTVTDADTLLGRIIPDRFAGGRMRLDVEAASRALEAGVGAPLGLAAETAALGVAEMVEEEMAAAARAHASEWGKALSERVMIAFGGAAPLHAARLAEKLGVSSVLIPKEAGVGSAVGFLLAPVAYEVVRSAYAELSSFAPQDVASLVEAMRAEAEAVVRRARPACAFDETVKAFMRYRGQGYEIEVEAGDALRAANPDEGRRALGAAFEKAYAALYGRTIPGLGAEILSWTLTLSERRPSPERRPWMSPDGAGSAPEAAADCHGVIDPKTAERRPVPVFDRAALSPGAALRGPALIVEDQTTTYVSAAFSAAIMEDGAILMRRSVTETPYV